MEVNGLDWHEIGRQEPLLPAAEHQLHCSCRVRVCVPVRDMMCGTDLSEVAEAFLDPVPLVVSRVRVLGHPPAALLPHTCRVPVFGAPVSLLVSRSVCGACLLADLSQRRGNHHRFGDQPAPDIVEVTMQPMTVGPSFYVGNGVVSF
ncbi:hypothetical protein TREES_T100020703 [Tupaia chinensis]|uniref:Uncharacterized protein n=1 Tax=Tupaia chinensis TaxID=246437 RepID=L9KQW9_TUPCH|nr:hypothetical protein TREES_T100020703 [Tupaia chinensis]